MEDDEALKMKDVKSLELYLSVKLMDFRGLKVLEDPGGNPMKEI